MTQDTKVDWGRPIEAVDGNERVWKAQEFSWYPAPGFTRWVMLPDSMQKIPCDEDGNTGGPWRIRNVAQQHRDTATIPRKGSCRNCAGTGWVCENHGDYPWAGVIGGVACCGGAGAPCGVCNHFPGVRNMVTTLSDDLTERMVALVKVLAADREPNDEGIILFNGSALVAEARAIVAEMEPVDEDLVAMREDAKAAGWNDSRLEQFEVGLLDLWKRARGRALERGEG